MANLNLQAVITAKDQTAGAFKSAESNVSSFGSKFAAIAGTALNVAGVVAGAVATAGAFAIKSAGDMEMLRTSLDTLTGSAEKGAKIFSDLNKFAASTPFETTDLAKASQTMLSFGIETSKVMPYLQMLGDVSMGNRDKLSGLSLAFSQVQSTGRLMGQDLLQMINQGFNPLTIIAQKTGRSMTDLKGDMEKGKISAEMVADAFKTATSEGGLFYKGMERGSKTFQGVVSTLKDNVGMIARSIVGLSATGEVVKGGLFDKVSQAAQVMVVWLDKNRESIQLIGGAILGGLVTAITTLVGWVYNTIVAIVDFFTKNQQGIAIINAVKMALDYIWQAFLQVWKSLQENLIPALQRLWEQIGPILGPALKILGEVVGIILVGAIVTLARILEFLINVFSVLFNWISFSIEKTKQLWDALSQTWYIQNLAKGFQFWVNVLKDVWDWLVKVDAKIRDFGGKAAGAINAVFGGGRASGGPVSAGTTYVVGENGPELFTPGRSGNIIPNGAGGGIVINIENVNARNEQEARASVNMIGRALELNRIGV